jgi:hypothetical protein
VFVDSLEEDGHVDPDLRVTALDTPCAEGQRVGAVMNVDLFGRCADDHRIAPSWTFAVSHSSRMPQRHSALDCADAGPDRSAARLLRPCVVQGRKHATFEGTAGRTHDEPIA